MSESPPCRRLVLVLGDQLNRDAAVFDDFDPERDVVWMAEVREESTHVWTHKARIAVFLSAMRHFRDLLRDDGVRVDYRALDADDDASDLATALESAITRLAPSSLAMVRAGEWRVAEAIRGVAERTGVALDVLPDRHFYSSVDEFRDHAKGRKQLRLEYFYRALRKKHDILLDGDGGPEGGDWNYDADNRGTFGADGPGDIRAPRSFAPDDVTRDVLDLVDATFPDHPGSLEHFDWPVTPDDAAAALDDFVDHRLPNFGQYQDAMWTGEPYLYHSRLSVAMNLKLLNPRAVVDRAVEAYRAGHAPLNSVEGFVRQILGWREYVRGIYWMFMPDYVERNELGASLPLPDFYWTGETDLECLRQAIGQTLDYGYAHHIQRLMVTGLFALLAGLDPKAVHEWYLAVYVDAVEWVELPNTLGMSQFADGGVMASKPYIASGKYVDRMSDYCKACRFDPAKSTGDDACPLTTLYWDFLARHADALESNPRMRMQLKNLERKKDDDVAAIRDAAAAFRSSLTDARAG